MRERSQKGSYLLAVVVTSGVVWLGDALPAGAQTASFSFGLGVDSGSGETGKTFEVLSGPGDWEFLIEPTGNVNTLLLSIRDSSPGDFCWYQYIKRPKGPVVVTAESVPEAAAEACGTEYPDLNGAPLAFHAGFQGAKKAGVTITVTHPEP